MHAAVVFQNVTMQHRSKFLSLACSIYICKLLKCWIPAWFLAHSGFSSLQSTPFCSHEIHIIIGWCGSLHPHNETIFPPQFIPPVVAIFPTIWIEQVKLDVDLVSIGMNCCDRSSSPSLPMVNYVSNLMHIAHSPRLCSRLKPLSHCCRLHNTASTERLMRLSWCVLVCMYRYIYIYILSTCTCMYYV